MNILLSLDEILDTRLGVLHSIDITHPKKMLVNDWHTRIGDSDILTYCDLSNDEYNEAYGKRTVEQLKNSVITNIPSYVSKQLASDLINFPEVEEMDSSPEVFLNTWPYKLTKEEADTFVLILRRMFAFAEKITLITVSPKYLTPRWLKDKEIYYFFNYDGVKWLNIHSDALLEFPLTRLKMYMPAIEQINSEPMTQEMHEEYKDVDRFNLVAVAWAMYITIQFIPVKAFSIVDKPVKKAK